MRELCHCCAGLAALFLAVPAAGAADADVEAIEKTYEAWLAATNEKDITRWSRFLAPHPYFSPADAPPLTSREAILAYYEKSFADPVFALDCEQLAVDVSESGDMAWSRGMCEASFTSPDGSKGRGASQWVKVWVKIADGSWKCRVNSWKSGN